nr:unnamed protein product [Callosobruchus chinensis]
MKRRGQNRLIWVHPMNERRNEVGIFYMLFEQLRQDDTKFFKMSITSFDELHGRIRDSIQRKNTKARVEFSNSSLFFIQFIKFATQAQANFTPSVSCGISVLEYFEGLIPQERSFFD